jgi:uncharacterized membrane protein YkvA (DUF1232 family)
MHRLLVLAKQEFNYYRLLIQHPETPRLSRWLLATALAYLLSPIDLIPDAIPVLGQLDDLLIVPGLVWLALLLTPPGVKTACRAQAAGPR